MTWSRRDCSHLSLSTAATPQRWIRALAPRDLLGAQAPLDVETVAVLFTDLVGSTALTASLGTAAAAVLWREYFGLLREAIAEWGGDEVKSTGDGLMVVFGSAAALLDCAGEIQQRFAERNRAATTALHVRIGASVGDAMWLAPDYHGLAVVEAARLCDEADAGQVLVSDTVRLVLERGERRRLSAVGCRALKGLPEPVTAWALQTAPAAIMAADDGRHPAAAVGR